MPALTFHAGQASIPAIAMPFTAQDLETLKKEKTAANGTFASHLVGAVLFTFGLPIYRRWDWDAIEDYDYWTRLIPFTIVGGLYLLYRFILMRTVNRAINADLLAGEKLHYSVTRSGADPRPFLQALGRLDRDTRETLSERYVSLAEGAELHFALAPTSRVLLTV